MRTRTLDDQQRGSIAEVINKHLAPAIPGRSQAIELELKPIRGIIRNGYAHLEHRSGSEVDVTVVAQIKYDFDHQRRLQKEATYFVLIRRDALFDDIQIGDLLSQTDSECE